MRVINIDCMYTYTHKCIYYGPDSMFSSRDITWNWVIYSKNIALSDARHSTANLFCHIHTFFFYGGQNNGVFTVDGKSGLEFNITDI